MTTQTSKTIYPKTYWVYRKRTPQYKRTHVFCQFDAEFRDEFVVWLNSNLDYFYGKYGKDSISVETEMSDGSRIPFEL